METNQNQLYAKPNKVKRGIVSGVAALGMIASLDAASMADEVVPSHVELYSDVGLHTEMAEPTAQVHDLDPSSASDQLRVDVVPLSPPDLMVHNFERYRHIAKNVALAGLAGGVLTIAGVSAIRGNRSE